MIKFEKIIHKIFTFFIRKKESKYIFFGTNFHLNIRCFK